jgi:hypothetical protein
VVSQFFYSIISFSASLAFKTCSILQQSPTNSFYASSSIFILNLSPVPILSKSNKSRIRANLQSWTHTLCASSIDSFFVTFCHSCHIQIHINLLGLQVQFIFSTVLFQSNIIHQTPNLPMPLNSPLPPSNDDHDPDTTENATLEEHYCYALLNYTVSQIPCHIIGRE